MKQKSFILGYSLVAHSFLSYLFTSFLASGLTNIVFPIVAANTGLDQTVLLKWNTVGGIVAAVLSIVIGQLVLKKGIRFVTVIAYILAGIFLFLFGHVTALPLQIICLFMLQLGSTSFCYMTTNNLIANWFPMKKGVVLGITTIGLPLGNTLLAPPFSAISNSLGFNVALLIYSAALVVMGIVSIFWVKNKPSDAGLYPDNNPNEEIVANTYVSEWTFAKLLKNKQAWVVMIGFGCWTLATVGAVSQVVGFGIFRGFAPPQAVNLMAIGGVVSAVISIISGIIDQKWGTKKTSILYLILTLIVFVILIFALNKTVVAVCLVLVIGLNGAPGNLAPSMFISKFGAKDFNEVNRLLMPVLMVFRACCFYVVGAAISARGNNADMYIVLSVIMAISLIFVCLVNTKRVEVAS